jgi:hypothetical protein
MHGPINVKSSNNISKWQMGFNSAFNGLMRKKLYGGPCIVGSDKVFRKTFEVFLVLRYLTFVIGRWSEI